MKTQTIYIASDHAGFDLKKFFISKSDFNWIDLGPANNDRTDYPDFAAKVAQKITSTSDALGVLICGSGIGMCISANKFKGVRAAVVESEETARLAKEHNNANILCLGSRILSEEKAWNILNSWISAQFAGGRHSDRIKKIAQQE
jgi:ribose 5-phosphate isomerase B